jgi:hypothetical protein
VVIGFAHHVRGLSGWRTITNIAMVCMSSSVAVGDTKRSVIESACFVT